MKKYEPKYDNAQAKLGRKAWHVDRRKIGQGRKYHETEELAKAQCDELNGQDRDDTGIAPPDCQNGDVPNKNGPLFNHSPLHLSDGRSFEIAHPEMIVVGRNKVVVGIPSIDEIPDAFENFSILHIVSVTELAQ